MLPVLGLGGQSLIQRCSTDGPPVELITRALDLGVRYLDTAPVYGESERRIGLAIENRRADVFLATKTLFRRGSSARRSLEHSLELLRTDYVDLFQLHCFMDRSEIGSVFARAGVMRMVEQARDEGLVRRVGITGHYDPGLLSELLRRYPFDSVLVPVNVADPRHLSFIRDTVRAAGQTGASVVAMKVMGAGLLTHRGVDPEMLLRYALSCPVSVAIVSCRSIADLEQNVAVASGLQQMDPEEMRECERCCSGELMQECNNIYKRHGGWKGAKVAVRNWMAARLTRFLPRVRHL